MPASIPKNIVMRGSTQVEFLGRPYDQPQASVIHRQGQPTLEDYEEAIQALIDAKGQLKPNADHCHVCGDSGCWAGNCHHNPLVAARQWSKATNVFRCYHCGYIATTDNEALVHFGRTEDEFAMCLIERARMRETAEADQQAVAAFCGGVEVRELPLATVPEFSIGPDIGPDSP